MQYIFSRGIVAALSIFIATAASGMNVPSVEIHHQAVDESKYPWSAIGKLYNGLGGACSGVVISHENVLTAAHCLFNYKTKRFVAAADIHFLIGYRSGRYTADAGVASYEVGPGFDPLRYDETSAADWAVLTVTEVPLTIEPLGLSHKLVPHGTRAVLAGYPQDRAHAMTADRDCELGDNINDGRLLLHTCRGIKGYSGAPILIYDINGEVKIAGIQIFTVTGDATRAVLAVPAQNIWRQPHSAKERAQ